MNKIKSVLCQLDEAAKKCKKRSKKPYIILVLDMLFCMLCFGASPNNYYYFGFYALGFKKKKTFVTHRVSEKLIRTFNDKDFIDRFEHKENFDKLFNKYTRRAFFDLHNFSDEAFHEFHNVVKNDARVIYKPSESAQGVGIKVLKVSDEGAMRKEISSLDKNAVIEQWIKQHKELTRLYPDSVNCLRVITLFHDGKFSVLAANLTCGNNIEIANASMYGIVCLPDLNSGTVKTDGYDLAGKRYESHPATGVAFKGFTIPYWKETIEMLKEAATVVPQIGYVGWDVAISEDGPVIIEGNTTPGYKFFQLYGLLDNNIGNKKIYLKACK